MIYPWQQTQWQHLQQRLKEGRLAHALLFTGPSGTGKNHFAQLFAKALLCSEPTADGSPCGQCSSCNWIKAESHPDMHTVMLEEDAKAISVNQIRALGHFVGLKSQQGRYKVILITPADAMNVNAANSLLKTLEEPTESVVIILVTHQVFNLPATIRSRCQKVDFPLPAQEMGLAWLSAQLPAAETAQIALSVAQGAPLDALHIAKEEGLSHRQVFFDDLFALANGEKHPVTIGEKWAKQNIQQYFAWFHSVLADMIKLNMLDQPQQICHLDYQEAMQNQARRLNLKQLYQCYERIGDAQRLLKANMNPQLLVESLLIPWTEMYKGNN